MTELAQDLAMLDRDDLEEGIDHDEILDRYWESKEYSSVEQDLAYDRMTTASGRGEVSVLALEILRCPLRNQERWIRAAREALKREAIATTVVLYELPHLDPRVAAVLLPDIERRIAESGPLARWQHWKALRQLRKYAKNI